MLSRPFSGCLNESSWPPASLVGTRAAPRTVQHGNRSSFKGQPVTDRAGSQS